jgi:uncharacterized membrane-anchored protein
MHVKEISAMGGSGRVVHVGGVVGVALMAALAMPSLARAQSTPAAQNEEARADELKAAWMAGARAATEGPADITLIDQATLKLPAGYDFIPKTEGARILRALGNTVGESTFVGLIVGTKPDDEWIVSTRFIGFIKDDDAKNWDADELLTHIKEGTAQANKDRVGRGFPELEVLGWVEKPAYDLARTVSSGRCSQSKRMMRIPPTTTSITTLMRLVAKAISASIC